MAVAWFQIMPRAAAGPPHLPPLSFLDHSWSLEFAFKASRGVLLGRDTVFTYGPLYQWLYSLPCRIEGFSLGSFFATNDLFQLWLILPFTYASAALLFRDYAPWKRAAYILLIAAFWQPQVVRASFLFLVLVFTAYQLQRAREPSGTPIVRAATTSLVAVGSFLFSADSGVYACAMLAVAAAVNLWFLWTTRQRMRPALQFLCLVAVFAVIWVLLINCFMGGPFYFGFWRASLDIANNYRWTMAGGMTRPVYHRFFAYIAFGFCAFVFAWLRRRNSAAMLRDPASLVSLFLSSLVVVQSGMVRSDWGHVIMGVFPLIAFGFAVLLGASNDRRYNWAGEFPALLAVALTGLFSGPSWYYIGGPSWNHFPPITLAIFKPVAKDDLPR